MFDQFFVNFREYHKFLLIPIVSTIPTKNKLKNTTIKVPRCSQQVNKLQIISNITQKFGEINLYIFHVQHRCQYNRTNKLLDNDVSKNFTCIIITTCKNTNKKKKKDKKPKQKNSKTTEETKQNKITTKQQTNKKQNKFL